MTPVTGDENGEGEVMGCGHLGGGGRGGETAPQYRRRMTQRRAARWLEVEDDPRKLGRWPELLTVPVKKYG
jgi:hypothetical protein